MIEFTEICFIFDSHLCVSNKEVTVFNLQRRPLITHRYGLYTLSSYSQIHLMVVHLHTPHRYVFWCHLHYLILKKRVFCLITPILTLQVLKLYAWEPSFEQQVLKIRDKEMKVLKQAAYLNASTSFIWACAPFLVRYTN